MTNETTQPTNLPEATADERTMGMVVWLLAIFTAFIGPMIIYFIKKDQSKFIGFHAGQAMFLNLIGLVLAIITCGLFGIVLLVVDIIWLIKANKGEWALLPVIGNWAWPKELGEPPSA